MANPIKGELNIEISGKQYTFVIGTLALAAAEHRLGKSWLRILNAAGEGEWGVQQILALFHAGLMKHQRRISEEEAADLIDTIGFQQAQKIIIDAVTLMQVPNSGGEVSDRPTNGAAGMSSLPIGSPVVSN